MPPDDSYISGFKAASHAGAEQWVPEGGVPVKKTIENVIGMHSSEIVVFGGKNINGNMENQANERMMQLLISGKINVRSYNILPGSTVNSIYIEYY